MRHLAIRGTVAAVAFLLPGLLVAPAVAVTRGGARLAVVVEASSVDAAARAVASASGRVDTELQIVGGVAATVDAAGLAALSADPALRVTPDLVLAVTSDDSKTSDDRKQSDHAGTSESSTHDVQLAALDPGDKWSSDAGAGVGVALVDTGVADTPDIVGRLVRGPDFSGENDGVDRYGHGTFMAGLIAGDGTASAAEAVRHTGVAPGATIVSVKVAGADGRTTLSKLIAAIGWVVVNRDEHEIRVMNLSFGVDTNLPYTANPLSGAVEAAWASGIAVVGASGNEGAGTVTSPGSDPWIVTAGASDTHGTASTKDDTVAEWSGREVLHGYAKPDVVAPGVSVVSLRAPGSTVDVDHPEGRVGEAYFRGSGTSMAAALVSGGLATLARQHPEATPDDLKGALVDGGAELGGGEGVAVSLEGADDARPRSDWWQRHPIAFDGLGLGLRGTMPWTATRWTATRWTATRWTATRWTATRWTATRWTATRWTDEDWAATRWTATRWTATRWTDEDWTATRWTDEDWTATRWTSASWNAVDWG